MVDSNHATKQYVYFSVNTIHKNNSILSKISNRQNWFELTIATLTKTII